MVIFVFTIVAISCRNKNSLPDPLEAGWNNQTVCEVLKENSKTRMLRCTFKPGIGYERHYHDPHIGYTLAGSRFRITDTTGVKEIQVPTGSSFSN